MTTASRRDGLVVAWGRLRDPVLLLAAPVLFGALLVFGHASSWPLGFDFRGTLWEPARALLDGLPIYPEPTREAIVVGNPAVYPPLPILGTVPLAFLPAEAASALWFALLGASVLAALWVVGIRDWRCHVLALTSPVVVHGLYYGNLGVALLLPVAVVWRYRERARVAGIAIGVGVAAKLLVWPLVVWLLVTRRFTAAAWAIVSAVGLVFGAWATIGFEGLTDYPSLLRTVQDVYAVRSVSLATVAAGLGASPSAAVALPAAAGIACLVAAARVVRGGDSDRRSFALLVTACIAATPIVWPNYTALLLVPIAVTWPRLAPAWFFGYVVWLVGAIAPKPVTEEVCCPPPGVTPQAWASSHAPPALWYAGGTMAMVVAVTAVTILARPHVGVPPRSGLRFDGQAS